MVVRRMGNNNLRPECDAAEVVDGEEEKVTEGEHGDAEEDEHVLADEDDGADAGDKENRSDRTALALVSSSPYRSL